MEKLVILLTTLALVSCDWSVIKDQTAFYNDMIKIDFGAETGYVNINYDGNVGSTFYHLVYKQGTNAKTQNGDEPVIIWINGGPVLGCTSIMSLYDEFGPFTVTNNTDNTKQVLSLKASSWNKQAHLLFVDQPYKVGFSYSTANYTINSTDESAQRFVQFLIQFYTDHTNLLKNPLYIFGESYGGHYVPAMGVALIQSLQFQALGINFVGVGIGDGQLSNEILLQKLAYSSSYMYSAGLVDNLRRDEMLQLQNNAQSAILSGDYDQGFKFFQDINEFYVKYTGQASFYNFKQYNEDTNTITPYIVFLNQNRPQFGVPETITYIDCNMEVFMAFGGDIVESREKDVVQLLEAGKRVLLYNGQNDFIVNTPGLGAMAWINQMKWGTISEWKKTDKNFFKVNNEVVGWLKSYSSLTFVLIYDAGHVLPTDQPERAFDMVKHWINNDVIWE